MAFPFMPPFGAGSIEDLPYQPILPRPSQATRNFCKLFIRCFTTLVGMGMVAFIFVRRFACHDPELQDNFTMIALTIVALSLIGGGFLITHEDDPEM